MNLQQLTTALASLGFTQVNPHVMLYKYQTGRIYTTKINPHWLDIDYSKTKADLKRQLRAKGESTNILSSIERQLTKGSIKPIMVLSTSRKLNPVIEGLLTVQVANYMGSYIDIPCRVEQPNNYTEEDLLNTIGTLLLREWNTMASFSINKEERSLTFHDKLGNDMFRRQVYKAMEIYHNYMQDPGTITTCLNEYDLSAELLVKYLAEGNPPIQSLNTYNLKLAAHLCTIYDKYFPLVAPHDLKIVNGRIVQGDQYSSGSYIAEDLELYSGWMQDPSKAFNYVECKSEAVRALAQDFLLNGPPDPGVLE